MRVQNLFSQTLRETSADVEIESHQLLLRAGYVRQLAAGIFSHLLLAHRAMERIARVLRVELDAIGGQEITMPGAPGRAVAEERALVARHRTRDSINCPGCAPQLRRNADLTAATQDLRKIHLKHSAARAARYCCPAAYWMSGLKGRCEKSPGRSETEPWESGSQRHKPSSDQ